MSRGDVITGFAKSTGIRCPQCGGGDISWLVTPNKPMPDPVECRCGCGHMFSVEIKPVENFTTEKRYTHEEIIAMRTPRGGYTRETLAKLGVPRPPRAGWLKEYLASNADRE